MVNYAPARFWRAFLLMGVMGLSLHAGPAAKTNRVPTDFAKPENPDQTKGAAILREFRNLGIAGDYYLEFQLRILPRRGEEITFGGQLWGSHNDQGAISRVVIEDGHGGQRQLLIQNGPEPKAWSWQTGQTVQPVSSAEHLFDPLLPETELTLFDLQMPYLFWDDFNFEGVSKIMGRAAHTFLLHPPLNAAPAYASIQAVRVQLDTQFHALVQSTLYRTAGHATKTLTVRDLKKVDDQWMVKAIDLRNEQTRDKTRFQVTRAAMNLDLSPQLFAPETLGKTIGRPTNLVSLGP